MGAAEKTRQMLAQALKELMKTSPLEKISVGDITQQAGVGRNTFYYHFKDKYDLVNWIFETESAQLLDSSAPADDWGDFLGQLDSYIRQNFSFYKNALDYSGQNSLQAPDPEDRADERGDEPADAAGCDRFYCRLFCQRPAGAFGPQYPAGAGAGVQPVSGMCAADLQRAYDRKLSAGSAPGQAERQYIKTKKGRRRAPAFLFVPAPLPGRRNCVLYIIIR